MAALRGQRMSTGPASMFTEVRGVIRPAVAFEIVLRGGERVVRVPQDFETSALGRLLEALGEC